MDRQNITMTVTDKMKKKKKKEEEEEKKN